MKGVEGSMSIELFVFIQLVTGCMGFLLGMAVREHERNIEGQHDADSDMRIYHRGDIRDRVGSNRHDYQIKGDEEE